MLFPKPKNRKCHRVVVTGAGIITALGLGWEINSEGFRVGKTAFRDVSLFDVSRHRAKRAAQVTVPADFPQTRLKQKHVARMDRAGKMLLLAASEAWNQAKWIPGDNIPVVLGTTSGGMSLGETFFRHALKHPNSHAAQVSRVAHYQAQRQALDVCDAFGFSGPITLIANACASGANSIGHAYELIRTGQAERALAGGYDAISELVFSGFDSLQALSTMSCRPFDATRDGLALGEGAAVLTLETYESATKRGAKILGELVGYGAATDCHHLTQPHPQGNAALVAMNAALTDAKLKPTDIGYINAHGTGTPLNDAAEAAAINRFAEDNAKSILVSSTKASIGHLLGAAGSVEAVICLMALNGQWIPPSATTKTIDPACQFQFVTAPTNAQFEYTLTNSFGFGGANASLIFRRWTT